MSHPILEQLNVADRALRETLHRHDLDATAREHTERALSHVHEAYIATNEIGTARSLRRLVSDLEKAVCLLEQVRNRQQRGLTVNPIRI